MLFLLTLLRDFVIDGKIQNLKKKILMKKNSRKFLRILGFYVILAFFPVFFSPPIL